MKRNKWFIVLIVFLAAFQVSAQKTGWIGFDGADKKAPQSTLNFSNQNTVSFSVQVPGMKVMDFDYENEKYQKISLPHCEKNGADGEPDLPMISELIAVPDCDDVILTVTPSNILSYEGYHVPPVPKYEKDKNGYKRLVYEKDVSTYSQSTPYPGKYGEILEMGYVRSQKVVRVALYPIQYNPGKDQLEVVSNFEINLSFINSTSQVNKELGIFQNMMHHAALNYEKCELNASMKKKMALSKTMTGSVTRVTDLDLLTGANALPVDYLIISHSDFYNSSYLTDLANHRKNVNGFDVVIVQLNAIYDDGSYSGENYVQIRDFIADVYENGTADHTYDGKLGYIVLVGDANFDNSTEMLPAAYPPLSLYGTLEQASDYYYACTGGDGDDFLDLMYGRLSVGSNTELGNVVNKIINYEVNSSGIWNNEVTFVSGSYDFFNSADYKIKMMTELLPPPNSQKKYAYMAVTGQSTSVTKASPIYGQTFTWAQYHDGGENCGASNLDNWIYNDVYAGINNNIHTFIYEGHGRQGSLRANEGIGRVVLRADQVETKLSNTLYPFMIFNACETGHFDATTIDCGTGGCIESIDCIAEKVVNLANKGAIGCLASTRDSDVWAFGKVDQYVLEAQYKHMSHLMGEAVMESKLRLSNKYRRQYNLFGDPALNLFPYGFTASQNIVWSDTIDISNNIIIEPNVTITIQPGTHVVFHGYHSITVKSGAKIIAEGTSAAPIIFTSASGSLENQWRWIELQGGDNVFKYCDFSYGQYSFFLNGCTAGEGAANLFKNCTFKYNSVYGIRFDHSVAELVSCEIANNNQIGVRAYYSTVDFSGNWIRNNNSRGVYTPGGSFLEFYGTVIEENTQYGLEIRNSSNHIHIGECYAWYGYNTIRKNGNTEVYVFYGSPASTVEMNYSSIHDDTGLEVYNYAGNPQVLTQNCYWGENNKCDKYGDVWVQYPMFPAPDWDGDTTSTGGPLHKASPSEIDTENFLIDPTLPKEDQVKKCKELIASGPDKKEAVEALDILFGILRPDFVKNRLDEKDSFSDYLHSYWNSHPGKAVGKRALQYLIMWDILNGDDDRVIKLSKKALKVLEKEEANCVMYDLAYAYLRKGWTENAKECLKSLKKQWDSEENSIWQLEEDIVYTEERIAKGLFKRDGEEPVIQITENLESIDPVQNYPNPGNPSTTIRYHVRDAGRVRVRVFNLLGEEVCVLVDEMKPAGSHEVVWVGRDRRGAAISSGVYLIHLETNEKTFTRKLTLLK